MENQVAAQQQSMLPQLTEDLSPTQKGWLKLEATKKKTFTELQAQELEVQKVLLNITEDKNLDSVQAKIKSAKNISATAKQQRLEFTGLINNNLINPSMEFEKRSETLLVEAGKHELELRKVAANDAAKKDAYNNELAALKAHIVNEYHRIAATYRTRLSAIITDAYVTALNAKTPVGELQAYISEIRVILSEVKLEAFVKFNRTLVDDKDAMEAFSAIKQYDAAPDLKFAIETEISEKFAMYEQDLQNAELMIKAAKEEQEKQAALNAEKLELEKATNTLIARAEVGGSDAPKVKKSLEVVEENSPTWAMAVMGHFIKNFQSAQPKLRVKSWGKLSISQMATALAQVAGETGEVYSGLTMKEIEK